MAFYESTFIVRPDASQQDVEKLTNGFVKIAEGHGGKLIKSENWGLRNLCYRVKKNRKGHYVMLGLQSGAEAINELERNYKINDDVIRFLTIKVEAISKEPSPVLRNDSDE